MTIASRAFDYRRICRGTIPVWPTLLLAGVLGLVLHGTAHAAPASTLPRRSDIRAAAAAVGEHYRAAVPCLAGTCAINNKWDNGVLMMGIIEHWRTTGSGAYRTYAENWASHNDWTLFSNTGGGDQENPNWNNRMTAGYTYLRLFQAGSPGATLSDVGKNLDDQLALKISPEREQLVNYVFPGSTKGSLSWKYVDANFTALPAWVAMGAETGDSRYYDRVRDLQAYQVDVLGLQNPTTRLWFQQRGRQEPGEPQRLAGGLGARERVDCCGAGQCALLPSYRTGGVPDLSDAAHRSDEHRQDQAT